MIEPLLTTVAKDLGISVGSRIRLREHFESYPSFMVDPGAVGTITEITNDIVIAKMDEHIDGCEEWDNELHWYAWDGERLAGQIELIP